MPFENALVDLLHVSFTNVISIYPLLTLMVICLVMINKWPPLEFFLNVSLTKIFVITVRGLEPATSRVRDQDASTVQARYMGETGSLN